MSRTLLAERLLMDRLRAASRELLGSGATDAEVEADAKRAYDGPEENAVVLTPEQRRAWQRQLRKDIAAAERAGVMDL